MSDERNQSLNSAIQNVFDVATNLENTSNTRYKFNEQF